MNDTIAAISTSLGVGAISIIRVSGNDAISLTNKIFKGKNLNNVDSHTIHYGHIMSDDKMIDEVLVSVMRAPKSFTMEDVVEINCHGGIYTTKKILEILLSNGCRQAEPGEFTKRAFLNGRIDLVEAEGIMDIITSKTKQATDIALNQINGKASNLIRDLREDLVSILATIEVNIDYPEYDDVEVITNEKLLPKLENLKDKIKKIIKESENGKIIKNGINTSIIGRPNVGKSSLLNRLLDEDKAIVTDIAGTTRDTVEGSINVDGLLMNIIDTAGIRETSDVVEAIGVEKSLKLIDESDLVLFVLNNNEPLTKSDLEILNKLEDKKYIIVVNKNDLEQKIDQTQLPEDQTVYISAINNEGIDDLIAMIKKMFDMEEIETKDLTYITNARGLSLLNQALKAVNDVYEGIEMNIPIDIIGIDIKNIWSLLGEITGDSYENELIDQLFCQFCLGK